MKVDFLKHLSYSNLNLYKECGRCWYLHYKFDYDLPVPTSWGFGGRVHKAIEEYHLKRILPKDSDLLPYLAVYSKLYKSKDYDFVEARWEVPIINPFDKSQRLDLPLQVKMDRVWRGWIHDVKTSASKISFEDVDNRFQTALYAYAYRQKFGKEEKGIRYDVLVKGSSPKLMPMDTFVTENDINRVMSWVWQVWNSMVEDFDTGEPKYHAPKCKRKEILP